MFIELVTQLTLLDQIILYECQFNQIYTIPYKIIDMNTKNQLQIINNHQITILCQICANSQSDIFVCRACYCLACTECVNTHICLDENKQIVFTRQFQKIEPNSNKTIELNKKCSEHNKSKISDLFGYKKYVGISCQRCFGQSATKKCCQCKIKLFCQNCFKAIHSSNKFQRHQFMQVNDKQEKTNNNYQIKITFPKNIRKKSLADDNNQISRQKMLANLQHNLLVVQDTLTQDYNNYQNQTKALLHSIQHSFQQLQEEVKLKMYQITNKLKESQQSNSKAQTNANKSITQQINKITNLRAFAYQQPYYELPQQLITNKTEKSKNKVQQILKQKQSHSYDRFCIEICEEIDQITNKLQKIDLKKIVQAQTYKNSLNDSVCYSDKNTTNSHKNETKKLKTFLNLNSYKSSEKLTPFQLGLTSPKKANMNAKFEHQFATINKSLFIQTSNSPSQYNHKEVDKCQTVNNLKSSHNGKSKNVQKDRKLFVTNLMSPKTTKKLDKNIENNVSKSNLVKAGIKIEKTKKMINNIRNQMMQFTNRFSFEKQGSKTSIQMNGQSLDVSQLSIQSFIKEDEH